MKLASSGQDVFVINDGVMLAVGCCLYLGTGMLLGVPFFVALVKAPQGNRWVTACSSPMLSAALWLINFTACCRGCSRYCAEGSRSRIRRCCLRGWRLATHLVFGWTLALLYPWGTFQPYQQPATPAR
ncbi:MAG: hypothetical protein U0872_00685 [Planctomycetaceae bacterium]